MVTRACRWDEGEFDDQGDLSLVAGRDALSEITENWECQLPGDDEEAEQDPEFAEAIAPFGVRFPGLAPSGEQELDDAELRRALGWFGSARIGLVQASRPADVLAIVGHDRVSRSDSLDLTVVLRSWEDRFDAVVVEVGFAGIRLLARRPPRTSRQAEAVAAELWAMSDEFWPIDKPGTALRYIDEIAACIKDIPVWSLWLD